MIRRWRLRREFARWATSPAFDGAPARLEQIAEFLDLADQAFTKLARQQGVEYEAGTGIQDELRCWLLELVLA